MLHQPSGAIGAPLKRSRSVAGIPVLRPALLSFALAAAFSGQTVHAQTLPTGGVAVHGQASFSTPSPQQLVVTTQNGSGSNHSAINWQSFSISAGASARINQPSATSLSINRVVTNNPSALFGSLSSNGQLVLVNPSGITVGTGAIVDTAGFTASALRMSDGDALAGRLRFGDALTPMGGASGITVDGMITARDGDIVLVAPQIAVGTSALLQATNGSTILAAGQQVEITGRGLEGITLLVQARENEARNLGRLEGDAVGIFAGTLRHSGEIQATTATLDGGRIVLKAVGDATVAGTLTATGVKGGQVDVFGERVALTGQALVDVSGTQGGGSIRIGGDFQGKNPDVPNAQRTYMGPDVQLRADATTTGDGGRVIVWSDDQTLAYGAISARGGSQSGDGGFVEVSGKHGLGFDATVDTLAAKGRAGTLLLDPDFIDIQATGSAVLTDVDQFLDGGSASLIIAAATINAAATNVILQANEDIRFSAPIAMLNAGVGLTAQAGFYITVDAGATITTRGGAVSLLAGDLGSLTSPNESAVFLNAAIDTTNGGTVPGGANVTIKSRLQDLGTSSIDLNASINAGSGGSVLLDTFASLSEGGSIRQFSGFIRALNLTALALEEINLGQSNLITGDVNLSSNLGAGTGGFIQFTNTAAAFNISGAAAKGNVTIGTSGAVSTNGVVQSTGGNVTISVLGNLSIGDDLLAAGTLFLGSSGGAITQSAGTSVSAGALATINAGGGNALLDSNLNDFSTVNVTGAHITLVDANALNVSAITQLANRNLYLQGVSGLLTIPGGAINTGIGQLSLISGGGAFTTPGQLSGSDVLLVGGTSLNLAQNVFASGNMTLFSSGTMTQAAGTLVSAFGTLDVTAAGTLTIQGGAGAATSMTSQGNQTVSANSIQVLGGAGGTNASAALRMNGSAGTQTVTATNGISIIGGANGGGVGGAGNYATISSNGNQNITVGNGGLTLTAGGGTGAETGNSALLAHNGGAGTQQSITVNGTGSINITAGSSTLTGMSEQDANRATILSDNGDSQTIVFTGSGAGRSINLTGGTNGSSASADIYAGMGTQSISGAGMITLTGGASGGGLSDGSGNLPGNLAAIEASSNSQSISAEGIVLQGGSGGNNNIAGLISSGDQFITVGSGGLTINGGSGGAGEHKNAAFVFKFNDIPATSQTITVTGGGAVTLHGGSSSDTSVGYDSNLLGLSNGSFAMIRSDGVAQLIEFTGSGGSINMTGGTVGSNNQAYIQAATGSQTIRGDIAAHAPAISLTGGASGGITGEANRAAILSDAGSQSIAASQLQILGGATGSNNSAQVTGETQTLTIGSGGIAVAGGGGTANFANINQTNASGFQTISSVGNIQITGGTGAGGGNFAQIYSAGSGGQVVDLTSAGTITVTGGGAGFSNGASIGAQSGNQSITGASAISILGGAAGGGFSIGNSANIYQNGAGNQSVTVGAGGLLLVGGGGTGNDQDNSAFLSHNGAGTQTLTMTGGGSITLIGGSSAKVGVGGSGHGSRAGIDAGTDASSQQFIVLDGGDITLTGGTNGSRNYAGILADSGTQSITGASVIALIAGANGGAAGEGNRAFFNAGISQVVSALDITLNGGANGTENYARIALTGLGGLMQTVTALNGISLTGGADGGGNGTGNGAYLNSTGSQSITVDSGGLSLFGGSGALTDNLAQVFQSGTTGTSQTITVNGGGSITLVGGSSAQTAVGSTHGSRAILHNNGDTQLIDFAEGGSLNLIGGTVGSRNFALVQTANGSQTIQGADTIALTGGANGGIAGEGNWAQIQSDAGAQSISAGSISLLGGTGGIENLAAIRQGTSALPTSATQTITIGSLGNLTLTGGSGTTSLARIQSYGSAQSLSFGSSSAIALQGGSGASDSFARIVAVNGSQSISGAPDISIAGGTGGLDQQGNPADIRAEAATAMQTIFAGNLSLTAGASGQQNYAAVFAANQTIDVAGDLTLLGGGSVASLDGTVGGGARIGAFANAAATTLSLTVAGDLSMTGGSVSGSGSAIGSNRSGGQPTNMVISAGGDITLNPGSVATSGSRIGSPGSNVAGGDIDVTAGGAIVLNGATANETAINTLGNVTLGADLLLLGGTVQGNTIFAYADSGIVLSGVGVLTASALTGSSIELIAATGAFTNSVGAAALNVSAPARWLVYSTDPSLDTRGGLAYDFKQYNATIGSPLGSGNGFLYSVAPTATVSLGGVISKSYDATNSAAVAPANLSVSAGIDGDVLTVAGPSTATYDNANAGSGKTVTLAVGAITVDALDGTRPVYGYSVSGGPLVSVMGEITPANITVSTNAVSKAYDGTTSAGGSPIVTTGSLFGSDSLSGGSFTFLDRNVGVNKTVVVTGVGVSDGNSGGNYNVSFVNNTTSSITALAAATWTGSVDTAWTNPANWAGGVVPDLTNVQAVLIPAGAGTVVFDASAGTTSLLSLTSARPISITGGNLQIGSLLQTSSYDQSGGVLSGAGVFNVTDSFSQSGGTISMGSITINQAAGNLNVGNLSAPSIILSAPNGAVSQSGALTGGGALLLASLAGSTLSNSGNQISLLTAANAGVGNITFVNTGALAIQSLANAGGNIDVTNTGGITTLGAVAAPAGNVYITANSPLTIGAGGVVAGGDIVLNATNLTSAGNLTLNGVLSAGNTVDLTAGSALVQNYAVFGTNGVTANAGTSMVYGPFATANNAPVTYAVGGVPVAPPPTMLASTLQTPGDNLLTTFLDLFQQTINGDQATLLELDANGNLRRRIVDGLVSEEELCR
jgi:filamentous hemagglutinin family protein